MQFPSIGPYAIFDQASAVALVRTQAVLLRHSTADVTAPPRMVVTHVVGDRPLVVLQVPMAPQLLLLAVGVIPAWCHHPGCFNLSAEEKERQ
jgi:hypothetical protein